MKLIIAGSRSITDRGLVFWIIDNFHAKTPISEVVCGCARGVDCLGNEWAAENNIPVKRFPAQWDRYANVAGIIRNEEMGRYADQLLLIWDGQSKGSLHMGTFMQRIGKPVTVHTPPPHDGTPERSGSR